jgi:phosphoglycerol transferase MdoB-like AlkP superfamily enzyme
MNVFQTRFKLPWLLASAFLVVALVTRALLLYQAGSNASFDPSLAGAFALGLLFDLGTLALLLAPLVLLLAFVPLRVFEWRASRWLGSLALYAGVFLLLFGALAEVLFWDEFSTRFNFIAVDYLVYTTEVVGNIRESYPIGWILAGTAGASLLASALLHLGARRVAWSPAQPVARGWKPALAASGLALLVIAGLSEERLPSFANNYNRELAKNGLWSLFAAFRSNVLDYQQFYATEDPERSFDRLRHELVEDGSILLRPEARDTLRWVSNRGPELHPNVIQITVESLSAKYLGIFDPASKLTPNLDALAQKSLVFENFYATGTRTDRGMEALTLSIPPTPGRSIVKRPYNDGLFTLGSVLRSRGYDTAFLYGGAGYFDNMNDYFGENGYRVIDREAVDSADVTFANAWGACDEDLLHWTMREADAQHAAGKPFHFFVMTTSNHRPYTYPPGRIDLPPKVSGRSGAVKYTDFAIGQFLREAASRPWYRDTVFVIVADHCASSAGRSEIEVNSYHIPLIVFAPGGQVAPGRVKTLTSQMDYAPTLLGLLHWSYPSRFIGHDVLRMEEDEAHALLGNYQKLGHLEKGLLVVLSPQRRSSYYNCRLGDPKQTSAAPDEYAREEGIAFYESASYLYQQHLYRELSPAEMREYSAEGEALARKPVPAAPTQAR